MSDITKDILVLTELTRTAHEAIADLTSLLKRVEKAKADLKAEVDKVVGSEVTERIDTAVEVGLANYNETVTAAIDRAEDNVMDRFDRLGKILLGEDGRRESMEEVIRKWMEGNRQGNIMIGGIANTDILKDR